MLGQNSTKLIIVCDEKTEGYANYLRQLISLNDDKDGQIVGTEDGSVEAIVWLEKEYLANAPRISSKEHILFIGENKTSKKEISNMNILFDKFGMQYGWLGKRGMMIVADRIKKPETYEKFIDFCKDYRKEFQNVVDTNLNKSKLPHNNASGSVEAAGIAAAEVGAAMLKGGVALLYLS